MVEQAFLDKGIVLGYCFLADPHHTRCDEYIHSESIDFYATEQIERVFSNAFESLIKNHRSDILDIVKWVIATYEDELSETDIDEIQEYIDRDSNDAWRYLIDFFDRQAGRDVHLVVKDLRSVVRELEKRARKRKAELFTIVMDWLVLGHHEKVRERLSTLRERDPEDLEIAIDAHDLASTLDGETELATTNPRDFDDDRVRAEIFEHTAIDVIRLVFVPRTYTPE